MEETHIRNRLGWPRQAGVTFEGWAMATVMDPERPDDLVCLTWFGAPAEEIDAEIARAHAQGRLYDSAFRYRRVWVTSSISDGPT
jgi:hypothetical protein